MSPDFLSEWTLRVDSPLEPWSTAAVAISQKILAGEEGAVENYLQFLSAGCTKDPVSLLKMAGVDLSTGEPVDRALEVFEDAIIQMENL